MRLITVVINDKTETRHKVLTISVLKNNVRSIEELKTLLFGAIEDFYNNKKIEYKPKEITWENLHCIPSYITQKNGFKVLRVYNENEVFFDAMDTELGGGLLPR